MTSRITFTRALAAILVVTGVTATAAARDVVQIRLRGYYYAEPASVQVTIAVEPAAENRELRVEAESEQIFRSSEFDLAGADEKRLHTIEFKNLPAGTYLLQASVYSKESLRGVARQQLIVSGGGR